jgi:hypothetical protein
MRHVREADEFNSRWQRHRLVRRKNRDPERVEPDKQLFDPFRVGNISRYCSEGVAHGY